LKWIGHVGRSRDAGHVAFGFGIFRHPLREILFLLLKGLWLGGNLPSFNNALPGRHRPNRAGLPHGSGLRRVIEQVPVRGVHRLPDSVKVRMAAEPRRAIHRCLSDGGNHARQDNSDNGEYLSHHTSVTAD
jgi:hypothetical protein